MTRVRPRLLGVFALALLVVVSATGVWAGEPTDTMRDFFGAVNLVLTDPRNDDQPAEKLRAIRRHVDEVLDVREAAMLALGRDWAARTAAEQNEFVALFADLLERSFVWRVAGKASIAGGVKVQYLGETAAGDTATVDTAVSARAGNDLRLEYRMVRRAGRWMVRDVVMDGVSTMDNYYAQFQRVVRDGSWPELMNQLRAKVGTPPVVQVAAPTPAPALAPLTPAAAPLAAPLALDPDRPAPDERHLAARDLAAVVTPGLAIRDVSPLPGRHRPPAPGPEPTAPLAREVPTAPGRAAEPGEAAPDARRPAEPAAVPRPAIGSADARRPPVVASSSTAPSRPSTFWIQVGAFRNATIAGRIAEQVRGQVFVLTEPGPAAARGEPILRVRVGPFKDRAQVAARLRELRAIGYQPFIATSN